MKRIPEDDYEQRRQLLADGWREIEVLETWEGPTWQGTLDPEIRAASDDDIVDACSLAFCGLIRDRLHSDPAVSPFIASMRKAVAIARGYYMENSLGLEVHGHPVDALIMTDCCWSDDGTRDVLVIDSIVVDETKRRAGLARRLVNHTIYNSGYPIIRAGTQMHNEPARALYKSLGMSVVRMERTFHR